MLRHQTVEVRVEVEKPPKSVVLVTDVRQAQTLGEEPTQDWSVDCRLLLVFCRVLPELCTSLMLGILFESEVYKLFPSLTA